MWRKRKENWRNSNFTRNSLEIVSKQDKKNVALNYQLPSQNQHVYINNGLVTWFKVYHNFFFFLKFQKQKCFCLAEWAATQKVQVVCSTK